MLHLLPHLAAHRNRLACAPPSHPILDHRSRLIIPLRHLMQLSLLPPPFPSS
jgi:hypothetical protein